MDEVRVTRPVHHRMWEKEECLSTFGLLPDIRVETWPFLERLRPHLGPRLPSDHTPELGSVLRATIADLIPLPMLTIAAVTGHATAGGFIITRTHDYVGDRGFIYMSELDIGVPIAMYAMSELRSRISDASAMRDLLLRPEKMEGGESREEGGD
ncbi:enoyl-CoA delta isomerase 1, peroxisomal-like [Dioscorea cayenensis subsp. rotundata]|uniref:Enoyl-CoA delta isomerase 1, peroxisomal-like n=1 Tax=Dioscorea cayennensis subsp. rotundata TaxID=55577 RepID=A0AB40AYQ4_DIOCR|nr:enoyl-CoA delta isomerase 1, peroxisomal-like [Dioscorea cayenensis subsp. rotundata]